MEKLNDYFLNLLGNPTFNPQDFSLVGLSADNTSLQDKDVYLGIDEIKNNPIFLTNGAFDLSKFDEVYNVAKIGYGLLSNIKATLDYLDTWSFYRGDITVPEELRNNLPEFTTTKIANPLRLQQGFVTPNISEDPLFSAREIAESQKAFSDGKWGESPNETWFSNFYKPKALALWDEDGVHIDPITGEEVQHTKGQKKLNANGTYYYEDLDGKSPYGRDILSAADTLTVDGSPFNKLDFLDSDDIDKSFRGSLFRAAAQIAPAFIPGIGEFYIGSRVLLNLTEIIPVVGKIFSGSNSKTLSQLEALNKTWSFSTSDSTNGSEELGIEGTPWTWETGLKLVADVFTQLMEQRFIFKYGTALLSGLKPKEVINPEAQQKWINDFILNNTDNKELLKFAKDPVLRQMLNYSRGKRAFMEKIEKGKSLGSKLSTIYMTAITTAGAYGEAKQNGASDVEAALFTLGYTAGEYALLRSDLGLWILPELKMDKKLWLEVGKALTKISDEVKDKSNPILRVGAFLKIFDLGKLIYHNNLSENSVLGKSFGGILSNTLSEGIEETSEELLADFSKALFTAAYQLGGSKTDLHAFENVFDRYALSFIGGGIGGAIAGAHPEVVAAKQRRSLNPQKAMMELVDIILQGKEEEFLKTVYKTTLGDKYLSAEVDALGNPKEGTASDNQDLAAKKQLTELVYNIRDILRANGADMSRNEVVDSLKGDLRYAQLMAIAQKDGNVLTYYLNRYNDLSAKIVSLTREIWNLEHSDKTDLQKRNEERESKETLEKSNTDELIKEKKEQLAKYKDLLDAYKDGRASDEFILDTLFEMVSGISSQYIYTDFNRWAENKEQIAFSKISEKRQSELRAEYNDKFKNNPAARELVHMARQVHIKNLEAVSKFMENYKEKYFKNGIAQNLDLILQELNFTINKNKENSTQIIEDFLHTYDNVRNPLLYRFQSIFLNSLTLDLKNKYLNQLKELEERPHTIESLLGRNIPTILEIKDLLNSENAEEKALGEKILQNLRFMGSSFLMTPSQILDPETDSREIENTYITLILELANELATNFTKNWNQQFIDFFYDPEVQKLIEAALNNILYLLPGTRLALLDFFNAVVTKYDAEGMELLDLIPNREKYIDIIRKKPSSPVDEYLEGVVTTLKGLGVKISLLDGELSALLSKLGKELDAENFEYSPELEDTLNEALQIINLALVGLESAKTTLDGDLNDLFGFNATVNEIRAKRGNNKNRLATLDSATAATIMQDIFKYRESLQKFRTIYTHNTDQQLRAHDEGLKVEAHILYNRLNTFIFHVSLDDWDGIKELRQEIQTSKIKEIFDEIENNDNFKVSEENKEKISRALFNLEMAVHNFFRKETNAKRLQDVKEVQKLLSSLNPTTEDDAESLNLSSKRIADSDFVWYLATLASKNSPESILHEYKECITTKFAPVIGQELAIKTTYAYLLNPEIFETFAHAYNANNENNFDKEDFPYLETNVFRSIFIEGLPGTGKSTGTLTMILRMLNKYHSSFLKKLVLVSNTTENAQKLLNNLKESTGMSLEGVQVFSKKEYFEHISNNYVLNFDKDGNVIISADDLTSDGEYKNITPNPEGLDASLVIIDEATSLSQQDALLEEKVLEEKGIYSIKLGDFDQLGVYGEYTKDGDTYVIFLKGLNYIKTQKLGLIFRGNNKHKTRNILEVRQAFPELENFLKQYDPNFTKIGLHYFQNEQGLYGDVIENATDDGKVSDETKNKILLMLDSLKEGEVLNFIRDDSSSELSKYLDSLATNDAYKDKINPIEAGASQSLEGQYYIVDLDLGAVELNERGILKAKRERSAFYTAISRAKLATLIFDRRTAAERNISEKENNKRSLLDAFNSVRIGKLLHADLSTEAITKYGKSRLQILGNLLGEYKKTEIEDKRTPKVTSITKNPVTKTPTPEVEEMGQVDADNSEPMPIIEKIENNEEGKTTMLLHSTIVQETGCEVSNPDLDPTDPNNLLILDSYQGKYRRIDGINGLVKMGLISPQNHPLFNEVIEGEDKRRALDILGKIRNSAIYRTSKSDILRDIAQALRTEDRLLTEDDVKVNFIYKNAFEVGTPLTNERSSFRKFFKKAKEYLLGIFNLSVEDRENLKKPRRQTIGIEVYIKNPDGTWEQSLELPLVMLTSPLTMLVTKGYELLNLEFEKQGNNIPRFMSWLENVAIPNNVPNAKSLWKQFRLYVDTSNFVVLLGEDFILNRGNNLTGIIHNSLRGEEYFFTHEYDYNGLPMSLEDYRNRMGWRKISRILANASAEDTIAPNGYVAAKSGDPFVLISDNPDHLNLSDRELLNEYYKLVSDLSKPLHIKRMYLYSPKVSITEYIYSILQLFNSRKDENLDIEEIDQNIGNKLSAYRLLKAAVKDAKFDLVMLDWISNLDTTNEDVKLQSQNRWEAFKDFVNLIADAEKNNADIKILDLLDKNIDSLNEKDSVENGIKIAAKKISGIYSKNSLRTFLSYELRKILYSTIDYGSPLKAQLNSPIIQFEDGKYIVPDLMQAKMTALENAAKNAGLDGILIHPRLKNVDENIRTDFGASFAVVDADKDTFIAGQSFKINGKLETTAVIMNIEPTLDKILGISDGEIDFKALSPENKIKEKYLSLVHREDTKNYNEGILKEETPSNTNTSWNNFYSSLEFVDTDNEKEVLEILKRNFNSDLNEEDYFEFIYNNLKNRNYLPIKYNNKIYVKHFEQKIDLSEILNITNSPIIFTQDNLLYIADNPYEILNIIEVPAELDINTVLNQEIKDLLYKLAEPKTNEPLELNSLLDFVNEELKEEQININLEELESSIENTYLDAAIYDNKGTFVGYDLDKIMTELLGRDFKFTNQESDVYKELDNYVNNSNQSESCLFKAK